MRVTKIATNLAVTDIATARSFYTDFLGLEVGFDLGWVVNLHPPGNPTTAIQLVTGDATAPVDSQLSVGVDDVDAAYAEAQERGYEIVHPLTDEEWGPRRFFVRTHDGAVINVVGHPA